MNYESARSELEGRAAANGETVLSVIEAKIRTHPTGPLLAGALMLTDRRVMFYGKKLRGRSDVTLPLAAITAVERRQTLGPAVVSITVASQVYEFRGVRPDWVDAVNSARSRS